MYLLDTNIISEARKGQRANNGVNEFLQHTDETKLFIAVQTIGEIRSGIEKVRCRKDTSQADHLEKWLDLILCEYADRILAFDIECAQIWGHFMSLSPQHPIDKQIAAIAASYDLILVTRNINDFNGLGVRLFNPFA